MAAGAVGGRTRAPGGEARDYRRMSAAYRLNRLFHPDSGRCIDVAVDHGLFGEVDLLAGIEDMATAIETLVAAGPDAIQLAPGQAPLLQALPGRKPALVLRVDVTNAYEPEPPAEPFSLLVDDAIGLAVRFDAACVCVNLLDAPGQGELRRQCMQNIATARAACERAGMPLMVEPLVLAPGAGGYADVGAADRIVPLVRQAAEMGADLVKAHTTDDLADYDRVVTAAGVPVLPRGGSRVGDREVLERTHALMRAGAAGIVYGRNVIQHTDPVAMVRALRAVVHEDATPDVAERALVGAGAAVPAR
jgi:class I fructose-bisphosphate aldolase